MADPLMIAMPPGQGSTSAHELTHEQFVRITHLLHEHAGIRMRNGKEGLVRARLLRRLRTLALNDFDAYLSFVDHDESRREFAEMIDALTTNKTEFLREAAHFDYLRNAVFPNLTGAVRIWSSGCSTGEEPYTLAMLCNEELREIATRDVRILATDINHRALAQAKAGVYPAERLRQLPAHWVQRFWTLKQDADGQPVGEASQALRRLVQYGRLNLMERWPMQGPFDIIFCRNVAIYFDKTKQAELWARFAKTLVPGGYLYIGHSERISGPATDIFANDGIITWRRSQGSVR